MRLPHALAAERAPQVALVVLQSDETIEPDMRRLMPEGVELLVSRVPSGEVVSAESLAAMEGHLGAAAALFPKGARIQAAGYACTSGAAQIGPERVGAILREACGAPVATDPLSALVEECGRRGWRRLALLSPYVAEVSERLRGRLAGRGIAVPVFGSFEVAEEAKVARIDAASVVEGGAALAEGADVDALFLSCTNLRTLDAIPLLEQRTGLPVVSSNLVLARHLARQAG